MSSKEDPAAAAASKPPSAEEVLNVNLGVLGHVDSGKTSLVKTLSTLLSTAALDKSKQSRQRGMTLDLGFSCFFLELPQHLQELYPQKKKLQMTLVDCPGHASLIRTIIGGAQIIDMVLLVVDAYKGWQAQTTECLVLAELTSPHLVVALNKVDMFPENEREEKLAQAKEKVRQRLANSKFPNAPMVGVSACMGGEKVAASDSIAKGLHPTYNIDTLINVVQNSLPPPKRNVNQPQPFYFSIDHCFPIKGMGTVLTGTVLHGQAKVNDPLEFPTLGLERKIKSMQMFKRKTPMIQQGDRAGICVSSLDSNLLERGVAATPGAIRWLKGALALIRKIPYYPTTLPEKSKFHISVGHTTVMATVTFFGARELLKRQTELKQAAEAAAAAAAKNNKRNDGGETLKGSSLGGDADRAGLPSLKFDWNEDFLQQPDGLAESLPEAPDGGLLHWAWIDFQSPVHCPLNSLVIGSRLDIVDANNSINNKGKQQQQQQQQQQSSQSDSKKDKASSSTETTASSCRLAFCGRLLEAVDPVADLSRIRLYTPKERQGVISRLGDPHRRQDDQKIVRYEIFGGDLFKKETLLKPFVGMKLVTPKGDVGELKSAFGTSGKFRVWFPAGTDAREGDALVLPFKRFANDPEKKMRQDLVLPAARPGSRMELATKKKKAKPEATGLVDKVKGDVIAEGPNKGKFPMAIISGLFTPEMNVREKMGRKVVIPSTHEEGTIAGAFGKAGKCKVSFENGIAVSSVGAKAELPPST